MFVNNSKLYTVLTLQVVTGLASSAHEIAMPATISRDWRDVIMSAQYDRLLWWPVCRLIWSTHERERHVESVIHHEQRQELLATK